MCTYSHILLYISLLSNSLFAVIINSRFPYQIKNYNYNYNIINFIFMETNRIRELYPNFICQ